MLLIICKQPRKALENLRTWTSFKGVIFRRHARTLRCGERSKCSSLNASKKRTWLCRSTRFSCIAGGMPRGSELTRPPWAWAVKATSGETFLSCREISCLTVAASRTLRSFLTCPTPLKQVPGSYPLIVLKSMPLLVATRTASTSISL